MNQYKQRLSRVLALGLTLSMLLSVSTLPALAADPPEEYPADMDAIVDLLGGSNGVDGEFAFDFLGTVYLGWRTTGGPWQNFLIQDFITQQMEDAGYTLTDDTWTNDDDFTDKSHDYSDDFFWVQHDDSSSMVWAPEYARMEITSITKDGTEVDLTDTSDETKDYRVLKNVVDVTSYAFDPTCDIYQAHYNTEYSLNVDLTETDETTKDEAFVEAMTQWINTKEGGKRTKVFPDGEEPGAPRGDEAHMNQRAHLCGGTSFTVTDDERTALASSPEDVDTIVKGLTGKVVYVGAIKRSGSGYTSTFEEEGGNVQDLKGAVLLTDTSNANSARYAHQVGAIAELNKASVSGGSYFLNPAMSDAELGDGNAQKWYDSDNEDLISWREKWYDAGVYEWYSDSARYTLNGVGAATSKGWMEEDSPVVEWNISWDQYNALKELVVEQECEVMMNVASVGKIYPMNEEGNDAAQGQLSVIAQIAGANPDLQHERVVVAAHVQEPSSNDNATGVALNLELATRMKKMIDAGQLKRPERTIVFVWGDEMQFSRLYLNAHEEDIPNIICSIDLDMTGEDPAKTGGSMRIEKAPDPSAYYNYTLDVIPEDGGPNYDDNRADEDGNFVRLPDSHTLWGAGDPDGYDVGGTFINDLYMAAAKSTAAKVKTTLGYDFEVDVCPYEGGSDHSRFLERGVPSVLTWHFTDYVYHTTVDTLYMSSADELESVGITSLAAAYAAANPTTYAAEIVETMADAAEERFDSEIEQNIGAHKAWADATKASVADAYAEEVEILKAWGSWYHEAAKSCAANFGSSSSAVNAAKARITAAENKALGIADAVFNGTSSISINDDLMSLSEKDQKFVVTLVMPAEDITGSADDYAADLELYLTRESSEQDSEIFPYFYPGDKLENWETWSTGDKLVEIGTAVAKNVGDAVVIELPFTVKHAFFKTATNEGINTSANRNAWPSIIGMYDLSVKSGDDTVGVTQLMVNMYDDYTRYDDTMAKLEAIQAIAEANGRYMEIVPNGKSEAGRDVYYVVFSDSKASVDSFQTMNAKAETDPASLVSQIKGKSLTDYRVPFFINNVHPDECPGVDGMLSFLYTLATEDTIDYRTLTGYSDGALEVYKTISGNASATEVDISTMFAEDVVDLGITGLGSQKFTVGSNGKPQNNNGIHDASELYTIGGKSLDVDQVLDSIIFIAQPNENPDGRTYNERRNGNGYDLNRDASNQTQSETRNLANLINTWNPVVMAELHGYMSQFLVEPCTPPHEPNLEYDLLVKNFMLGAEAFGTAALGTISNAFEETHFWSYYTPLRDDYDPKTTTWSAWDDLCTNYGPSYAMLNCGTMGYTIETPFNNQASSKLFEYGMYGLVDYVLENKEDIYLNQLEFFQRGLENRDERAKMESWYVDISNNTLASDTWRVPYEGNNNYFPEYYVIPVDMDAQRDVADAYEMGQFLLNNGVKLSKLTADVTVDGVTYKAGSLVVNMYQAKRNYANAVLWQGADASASGFPDLYSESVSNFPEMRGFDCIAIDTKGAFDGKLTEVTQVTGATVFTGSTSRAVVIANSGNEAVRAVNAMLNDGVAVGLITEGEYKGDFVVSYRDFQKYRSTYVLSAIGVSDMPVAYQISQPTIYLAGRYDAFSNQKVASGYYAQWFSEGYGFDQYRNVRSNEPSNNDMFAYVDLLHFKTTEDPTQADVIVGSVALNQGERGEATVNAVKAGTPYIATSRATSVLRYIKENLITDMDFTSLGMEALHKVEYPTDSLTTASYVGDEDFVAYTYNCAVITALPEGAQVLIKAVDTDSFIAGCCLNEQNTPIDGMTEAFAWTDGTMDITVFANSITNRTHQQDDLRYVTNTIYSKMLADTPMSIASNSGGSSGSGGSSASTVTLNTGKNGTVTVTPKSPVKGDTVTITVKPDGGYVVDTIAVTDGSGNAITLKDNGNGTYTYIQPSSAVTVKTTFKAAEGSTGAGRFTDISGHWAESAINYVADKGLMNGVGGTLFSPALTLDRGMIATILYRMEGSPAVSSSAGFADVPDGTWYTDAVNWAYAQKIVTGYSDTQYGPTDPISREQLAVILYRYAAYKKMDLSLTDLSSYPDSDAVSSWAVDGMRWAVAQGLISGKDGGRLDPLGTATRAEVATIFMRFLER